MTTSDSFESDYWGHKVYDVLIGAVLMWLGVETLFVFVGAFWKEFLGGFGSYLALTSALIASGPLLGWKGASRMEAEDPWACALWCAAPTLLLFVGNAALSSAFRRAIEETPSFGFAQFANTGAWLGVSLGLFAGLAYTRRPFARRHRPVGWRRGLGQAAAGAVLAGGLTCFLGLFLDFSRQRLGLGLDWSVYFFALLALGTPFIIEGLAGALNDHHPAYSSAWSVLPTFAALYFVTAGAAGLIDLSQARETERLPALGGLVGAAGGGMAGLSFRKKEKP